MSDIKIIDSTINTVGGQVFIRQWNNSSSTQGLPPVVLLHDSLGCVEMWRDFPMILLDHLPCELIAYDRHGFGKSSVSKKPPSLDFIDQEAATLAAVCERLGHEQVILFGHSVGGAMSISAASQLSESNLIAGVITVSAQAFVEERTKSGIRASREFFKKPENLSKLSKFHGDKAQWVLNAWTESWLHPNFATWSLDPHLPNIDIPVLAIHGDQDEYGSCDFPRRITQGVSGISECVILEGIGHVPHRENPQHIAAVVAEFICKQFRTA